MKNLNTNKKRQDTLLSAAALACSKYAVNHTCVFTFHQEKLHHDLKSLRRFEK